MLDYDSMRSKVKRLTEKPDKDASKLPRAEKEADMVSMTDFLDEHRAFPSHASLAPSNKKRMEKRASLENGDVATLQKIESNLEGELVMPTPPEVSQRPEIRKLKEASKLRRSSSIASAWSSNLLARLADVPSPTSTKSTENSTCKASSDGDRQSNNDAHSISADTSPPPSKPSTSIREKSNQRQRSDSRHSCATLVPTVTNSDSTYSFSTGSDRTNRVASSTDNPLLRNRRLSGSPAQRSFTSPLPTTPSKSRTVASPSRTLPISPVLYSSTFTSNPRNVTPNPFFSPSELHEIMLPIKRAFMLQRADDLKQAKAAYEQLNEQLSTELPQLIDLRVPYLDPSFEALVKIQLRFCAEAYSRMAQVQQCVAPFFSPVSSGSHAQNDADQANLALLDTSTHKQEISTRTASWTCA